MEAAGLIVGVIAFGFQLTNALQVYAEGVAEADDRINTLTTDVATTASTLSQLQDLLSADTAAEEAARAGNTDSDSYPPGRVLGPDEKPSYSTEAPAPPAPVTVFKEEGRRNIETLAVQCQKVYRAIIQIIVNATESSAEGRRVIATNLGLSDLTAARLAKLGRNLKWPWVERRVKACLEELRWLRMSLLLQLQIGSLARLQLR